MLALFSTQELKRRLKQAAVDKSQMAADLREKRNVSRPPLLACFFAVASAVLRVLAARRLVLSAALLWSTRAWSVLS